jgi:uncharacterized protein YndB with AHSA1/START domain
MPVGRTKDAGWQIGVSITVDQPAPHVWSRLVGADGVATWLGPGVELSGERGETFETTDGVTGEVRSFRPGDRVRLTWQPDDWDHETTVQIALDDRGDRTGVRFHQERLSGAAEREAQRRHWKQVAERLRPILEAPTEI